VSGIKRLAFIDVTRGILMVCMVVFHAMYMAVMFKFADTDLWSGFWWWFARIIAAGFVLLAGWSYAARSASGSKNAAFPHMAKRALKLGIIALVISIVTIITFGKTGFVFFGVLHLITVCYLAAWPLRNRPICAACSAVTPTRVCGAAFIGRLPRAPARLIRSCLASFGFDSRSAEIKRPWRDNIA